jgi:hypothetical protein
MMQSFQLACYLIYSCFRCLIPRFDGAMLSLEWKEALQDKFVTGGRHDQARCPSNNTAIHWKIGAQSNRIAKSSDSGM